MDFLAALFHRPKRSAKTGPYRRVAAPDGRVCAHLKKANNRCLDVVCWNFEPDIVRDSEGRSYAHTKNAAGRCFIARCWNSVQVAADPAKALAMDADLTHALEEHADRTTPGWRDEFASIEDLTAAAVEHAHLRSERKPHRP